MTQKIQTLFICCILLIRFMNCNQICQNLNPSKDKLANLALNYAKPKFEQQSTFVVQLFEVDQNLASKFQVELDAEEIYRYSFNIYKFDINNENSKQKQKQLELHLRYMLYFRKSFEFKHLSDNGCFVIQEESTSIQYIILKIPGERIEVKDWFQPSNKQNNEFFQYEKTAFEQQIQILKQNKQNVSNLLRKLIFYNPFFSMDISLQFLIALAKMHKQNILHLNIKPFNLKLLNRYCLALDNFENATTMKDNTFITYQNFSEQNPYNGKNTLNVDISNGSELDYTDDLHSAGLTIYQLCTLQTLPNEDLIDQIKLNFSGLINKYPQSSLLSITKQWCGQLVYDLIFQNNRITIEDLDSDNLPENIEQIKTDMQNTQEIKDGKYAVRKLIDIMKKMKKSYSQEFNDYYNEKINYLQSNQISQATLDIKDKLLQQTLAVKELIENNENDIDQLLEDSEIDGKNPRNIFKYLPQELSILNSNTAISSKNNEIQDCLQSKNDITQRCLDQLFKQDIQTQNQSEETQNVLFDFQNQNYQGAELVQILDQNTNGDGYNYGKGLFGSNVIVNNNDYLLV